MMKHMSRVFWILAALLSHVMCAVVGFKYCDMLWRIRTQGASAPASVALLYAIPFAIAVAVCIVVALRLNKREG